MLAKYASNGRAIGADLSESASFWKPCLVFSELSTSNPVFSLSATVCPPINSTGWVKWYQEANKELGLNLNQEPKDWDQFLKLVASYFSMAIYANVTLGQKVTKEVKVWDGQNFQFLAIENNEDQAQCFSKRKQSWNYC